MGIGNPYQVLVKLLLTIGCVKFTTHDSNRKRKTPGARYCGLYLRIDHYLWAVNIREGI